MLPVLKVIREILVIRFQLVQPQLLRVLQEHRDRLGQRLPYRVQPEPQIHKVLRALKEIFIQRVLKTRRMRKVQLALLGLQDIRVHPVRKEWRRQYRALQGLPDLRE